VAVCSWYQATNLIIDNLITDCKRAYIIDNLIIDCKRAYIWRLPHPKTPYTHHSGQPYTPVMLSPKNTVHTPLWPIWPTIHARYIVAQKHRTHTVLAHLANPIRPWYCRPHRFGQSGQPYTPVILPPNSTICNLFWPIWPTLQTCDVATQKHRTHTVLAHLANPTRPWYCRPTAPYAICSGPSGQPYTPVTLPPKNTVHTLFWPIWPTLYARDIAAHTALANLANPTRPWYCRPTAPYATCSGPSGQPYTPVMLPPKNTVHTPLWPSGQPNTPVILPPKNTICNLFWPIWPTLHTRDVAQSKSHRDAQEEGGKPRGLLFHRSIVVCVHCRRVCAHMHAQACVRATGSSSPVSVGLARTVYIHRTWPYVWWFPCQ